jgi:ATP-dependent DNA helicase PIF1
MQRNKIDNHKARNKLHKAKNKIVGAQVGREVYVPRLKMSMDDLTTTYKIKRRQYPISVCFATIIIKS